MIAVPVMLASLPSLALATTVMPPAPPPPIPPPGFAGSGVGGLGTFVQPLASSADDVTSLTSTTKTALPPLPGAAPGDFGYDDDESHPDDDDLKNVINGGATTKKIRTKPTDTGGNSFDHATEGDTSQTNAADIMRLMRGGRGRKSVHSHARPPPALRRCYSAEPGGQHGSWSSQTGNWPVWIPNPRCSDLPDFDENRVVQCLLKSAYGQNEVTSPNIKTNGRPEAASSRGKPVWLALVGDASIRSTYECLTGGSHNCIDIGRIFQSMGYERLVFDGSSSAGQANNSKESSGGDHDTVFWPPKTDAATQSLPPLRISFRLLEAHRSEFIGSKGLRWQEMLSENGAQHVIENWLSSRAENTWGEQPTALLFSSGRSLVPSGESVNKKDCSTAKASAAFLRAIHSSSGSQLLWVTVSTPRPTSHNEKESAEDGPTTQQILWDRECGRMLAKHYRLPFVDTTELTEAAWRGDDPDLAVKIVEPDGLTLGLPIQHEILRRWMPQLCQELPQIPEK